jgi:hypothetical protein
VELNDSGYYADRRSDFERRVGWAAIAREKAAACGSPDMTRLLAERWGRAGYVEVDAALSSVPEECRRSVCHRLLAERGGEAKINRRLRCRRIAFTPAARQCVDCGHDWHGTDN